jgi:hypothetical protein
MRSKAHVTLKIANTIRQLDKLAFSGQDYVAVRTTTCPHVTFRLPTSVAIKALVMEVTELRDQREALG